MITTVLGSCVATCLWDPDSALGGMNHILLPDNCGSDLHSRSHGTNAMELLINALLRRGADRRRLRAKLFGGARMIEGLSDIGQANARFAKEFCHRENIPCIASSLGGIVGRRIQFWPATGKARQMLLRTLPDDAKPVCRPAPYGEQNGVELF
ncbi:chemotaxis protein CheD [Tropicimonas sp. IMCC6043]|uniref:chemotaxis protein CheD n=1 Tax=Tropicimonas sp. IMCC6043 TaxID=2510645 RepID=UPI00101B9E97|nr:chemotaxis protein CheD [Tropicimonas sp. IMCC6043]